MTARLLLSAGRGPDECAWAVAELARRLEGEAARAGVRVRRGEEVPGDIRGTFRSVVLEVGDAAFAATWTGTLCWQAPSPYRPGIGRKNWYVSCSPLDTVLTPAVFDEADVEFVPVRTGGPGGQHRNKASTAVRATHRPTGTVVVADTERRLTDNRRVALARLRSLLQHRADAAQGEASSRRRDVHDELIRGAPVRTERP